MTSFLEKLKKGMEETNFSQEKNEEMEEAEEKVRKRKPAKIPSKKASIAKKAGNKITAVRKGVASDVLKTDEKLPDKELSNEIKERKPRIKNREEEFVQKEEIFEEKPQKKEVEINQWSFAPAPEEKPPTVFNKIKISNEKNWLEPEGQLTVDVYETEGEIVVRSAIAGVKPEDLDISIENDILIIKGERKEYQEEVKNYYYQECYWGKFSREIVLPEEVNSSKAAATMKDGILTIRIPKINKGKKISISGE